MKRIALAAMSISGVPAATTIAMEIPALAAPSGPGSVQDTVSSLEASGYKVILNKVGTAPLDQCSVSAVLPGQEVTELRQNVRERTVERIVYTTVYVDADC
jgi:hypothetical protein